MPGMMPGALRGVLQSKIQMEESRKPWKCCPTSTHMGPMERKKWDRQ